MSDEEPEHVVFSVERGQISHPSTGSVRLSVELIGMSDDEDLVRKVLDKMRAESLKVYAGETLLDQAVTILKEDLALEKRLREDEKRKLEATISELQADLSYAKRDLTEAKERVSGLEQLERELSNLSRLQLS